MDMDPISIAASVAGLLAFGSKVVSVLFSVVYKAGNAPSLAQSLLWEVSDISAILGHLDRFIQGRVAVSSERGSMIPFKHVVASLSGCVMTYSELQQQLDKMDLVNADGGMGVFGRLAWVRKEATFSGIVGRLQNHKASMTLMLTILQCQASQEAESCIKQLQQAVEKTLQDNQRLAERMRCLERHGTIDPSPDPSHNTQCTTCLAENTSVLSDDRSTIYSTESGSTIRHPTNTVSKTYQSFRLAFERDLRTTRVYRRAAHQQCFSVTSLPSTALYSTALSLFSSLSWDKVSNMSVFALPVFISDLGNSEYYPCLPPEEHIPQTLDCRVEQSHQSNLDERASFPPSERESRTAVADLELEVVDEESSLAEFDAFRREVQRLLFSVSAVITTENSLGSSSLRVIHNTNIGPRPLWQQNRQQLSNLMWL
ncbi:hypothetical protein NUW58_g4889 [Xylaria curta]|uniref:Uncharacterized protein n=1 Tax=Xylaria curta TaxID=42375 RepID=A0ACC1P5X9_9PEZI|nr:hypothetical protein NUW58_g4889 [Xylaria curta]